LKGILVVESFEEAQGRAVVESRWKPYCASPFYGSRARGPKIERFLELGSRRGYLVGWEV